MVAIVPFPNTRKASEKSGAFFIISFKGQKYLDCAHKEDLCLIIGALEAACPFS
nr:hypothetical protein [uncultured Flavobacterium sp.]